MPTFKLLHGRHVERPPRPDNKRRAPRPRTVYQAGGNSIIATDANLLRFNSRNPNIQPKFRKISDEKLDYSTAEESEADYPENATAPQYNDALDDLSVAKLKKIAEEEEIDLAGCNKKDEIIAAIRGAL